MPAKLEKKIEKKIVKKGKPVDRQRQRKREELFEAYWIALHDLVDQIFEAATNEYDLTWNQLSKKADVAYVAVQGLGERITQRPQFYTVYRLAVAVGMEIELKKIEKKHKVVVRRAA